jgi:hypothetical protein
VYFTIIKYRCVNECTLDVVDHWKFVRLVPPAALVNVTLISSLRGCHITIKDQIRKKLCLIFFSFLRRPDITRLCKPYFINSQVSRFWMNCNVMKEETAAPRENIYCQRESPLYHMRNGSD